jgi:hypothetical protein
MGLRPALVNPRTLVRTWGTQTESTVRGRVNRDTLQPSDGLVIPTVVEGSPIAGAGC